MSNEFINFLNGGYKGIAQIRNVFPNEVINIIDFNKNFINIHWGNMLYNYINNISFLPKCKCGDDLKFLKFNKGYYSYCSNECRYSDEELIKAKKIRYYEKHGCENPMQSPIVQEKRKRLFYNKHGVEHQSQLPEVKEKRKQTNLERFGVITNLLCEDTKNKIKETNLKLFGVEHNSQSQEIKEKKKLTNLKNCGAEYNFNAADFKEKSKITCLEKYDVEYTAQAKFVRDKQIETRHINQINKISELLGIDSQNITINDHILTIHNYCSTHDEFNITPNNLHQRWHKYDKKICTKCYPLIKQISNSENELKLFIDSLNVEYNINNKKLLKKRFEIDIFIPNSNLAIEYDGIYWHSTTYKNNLYHLNKTNECEKLGIQLLHIFEDEWLHKKEIVKSIIKNKLDLFENEINETDCSIVNVDTKLSSKFLNDNHIEGTINSDINIGLEFNNELVSIITLNKINDSEYELLRFCDKLNHKIMDSFNYLLAYFIEQFNTIKITVFIDRRYSQGNLFKKFGFEFVENTEPREYYFDKKELIRFNNSVFMKNDNYFCIYDCGYIRLELKIK